MFTQTIILGSWLSLLFSGGPKAMFAAIAKFFAKLAGGQYLPPAQNRLPD